MGAGSVALVYARWAHLPDRPFRLLVYMALVTLDDDDPPRYWAGRELLAAALGRIVPGEPDPADKTPRAEEFRRMRAADFQAVKNALRPLFNAGVVVVDATPGPRRNAVYRLTLGVSTGKVSPTEQGRPGLPTGKVSPTEQGRPGLPPMRMDEEEEQGGTRSPEVTTSPDPVDNPTGETESAYSQAASILERLPDLGADLLSRVPTGTLRERIITAAAIYLAQNTEAS
jgi:hypothetical protein